MDTRAHNGSPLPFDGDIVCVDRLPRCRGFAAWHTYDPDGSLDVVTAYRAMAYDAAERLAAWYGQDNPDPENGTEVEYQFQAWAGTATAWDWEYAVWAYDAKTADIGRLQGYTDSHNRRAWRFLQEQGIAVDFLKARNTVRAVRGYRAAWARYRWGQMAPGWRANGLRWLDKAQWACVESIYAEALGLAGKTGRDGRPVIARKRVTDAVVRRHWRRAMALFDSALKGRKG